MLKIVPVLAQDDGPPAKVKGVEPVLDAHEVRHLVPESLSETGVGSSLLLVSGARHIEGG